MDTTLKGIIDTHFSGSRYLYDAVISKENQRIVRELGGRSGAKRTRCLNLFQKEKLAEFLIHAGIIKSYDEL